VNWQSAELNFNSQHSKHRPPCGLACFFLFECVFFLMSMSSTTRLHAFLSRHIAKQLSAGWRGLWGACCLAWFLLRVTSEALVRGVGLVAADVLRQTFGRGGGRSFSAKEADDSDDALLEGSGDRRSEGTGANSDANPAWT